MVNELLARDYQVRAVTSKPVTGASASDRLEWRQLNFQESLEFDSLVQDCDAVIHLGAEMGVVERMQRSNAAATRALAEASERAAVKFFCYTSSVAVYGSSRRRQVLEDGPVLTADRDVRSEYWDNDPLRSYGRTKLQGELAINTVAHNVEYVVLRPTVVVDVQDLVDLGGWIKAKKHWMGSRYTHHIYVYDVADAIVWFMERGLSRDQPSPGVSTFNLSEDDAPINTYSQIFKAAYEASGDQRWRAAAIPWPVEWLLMILRYRRLILRQPFGRVLFSGGELRKAGYSPRFGMSHAISAFCKELTSASTNAVKDGQPSNDTTPAPATFADLQAAAIGVPETHND